MDGPLQLVAALLAYGPGSDPYMAAIQVGSVSNNEYYQTLTMNFNIKISWTHGWRVRLVAALLAYGPGSDPYMAAIQVGSMSNKEQYE